MAELTEGTWSCKVLGGEANADDKQIMIVRVNVEIMDGPDKGRRCSYEEQVNNKSAKYVVQCARAVGWKANGQSANWMTFKTDVDEWIKKTVPDKTGGNSTLTVENVEFTDKKTGLPRIWGKPKAVGRGPKALKPPTQETLEDANAAARAALAEAFGDSTPPPSDYIPPHDDADAPPF